jgi:hypothetical protein
VSLVARVTALAQAIAADIKSLTSGKVDKVSGKGLSAEDYSADEKSKLAGIASGAQVNNVTSVAGRTGAVTLTKSDVGLANVDNTADSAKPVSVAQQAALDLKASTTSVTNAINANKRNWTGSVSNVSTSRVLLTSENGGSFRLVPTSPITITLPATPPPGGAPYLLRNESQVAVTVTSPLLIYSSSGAQTNSLELAPNEWIEIASNVGSWVVNQRGRLDQAASITKPYLLGPVIIAPQDATSGDSALVIARELANTAAVNIPQALGLNFVDKSKAARLSAQLFRLAYTRDVAATGAPTSFDAMAVLTPVININAPYSLRGLTMEGPNVAAGATLQSWIAARIQAPSGAGAVTSRTALMIDPNAGNALFGTITDNGVDMVQVTGSMSSSGPIKVGQYTLTTLPSASAFNGYEIDVTNSTVAPAGPKRCRSNGINWLILNTNTPVS